MDGYGKLYLLILPRRTIVSVDSEKERGIIIIIL